MASFSKHTSLTLLSLLLLQGCGETGGLAPISGGSLPYDGVTCEVTVESDLSNAAFTAMLQDGVSNTEPFIICVGPSVTIGSTGTNLDINKNYVRIQGYSEVTSVIHNARISARYGLHFQKLAIFGTGGPGVDLGAGIGEIANYKVIGSVVNSNNVGLKISADIGGSPEIEVRTTAITATGHGIQGSVGIGGILTATISYNAIMSNQNAINLSKSDGGIITTSLGPNILAASGANASASSAMHFASGIGGIIEIDAIDSGTGTACNVPSSPHTFNQVFSTQLGSGAIQTGTWTVANMTNANNATIGACPNDLEIGI
jgi:hypothetical protein